MSTLHTCGHTPFSSCDACLAVQDDTYAEAPRDLLAEVFQAVNTFHGPAEAPFTLTFGQVKTLVQRIRELEEPHESLQVPHGYEVVSHDWPSEDETWIDPTTNAIVTGRCALRRHIIRKVLVARGER